MSEERKYTYEELKDVTKEDLVMIARELLDSISKRQAVIGEEHK